MRSPAARRALSHGRRARVGFTLLEVLIALGLLIAVSAVVLPSLAGPLRDQRAENALRSLESSAAEARSDAQILGEPIELYAVETGGGLVLAGRVVSARNAVEGEQDGFGLGGSGANAGLGSANSDAGSIDAIDDGSADAGGGTLRRYATVPGDWTVITRSSPGFGSPEGGPAVLATPEGLLGEPSVSTPTPRSLTSGAGVERAPGAPAAGFESFEGEFDVQGFPIVEPEEGREHRLAVLLPSGAIGEPVRLLGGGGLLIELSLDPWSGRARATVVDLTPQDPDALAGAENGLDPFEDDTPPDPYGSQSGRPGEGMTRSLGGTSAPGRD